MSDWSKAKAREVIDRQITLNSISLAPDAEHCEGMIQMAYALGLLTDQELQSLTDQINSTVTARRKQLRTNQNAALLGLAVTHG